MAARVMLGLPEGARGAGLRRMLEAAEEADAYRRARGRPHPLWGDGSLMAAALRWPMPAEPPLEDPRYCSALARVFEALVDWRCGGPPRCG